MSEAQIRPVWLRHCYQGGGDTWPQQRADPQHEDIDRIGSIICRRFWSASMRRGHSNRRAGLRLGTRLGTVRRRMDSRSFDVFCTVETKWIPCASCAAHFVGLSINPKNRSDTQRRRVPTRRRTIKASARDNCHNKQRDEHGKHIRTTDDTWGSVIREHWG
jgi:hypothetical protein